MDENGKGRADRMPDYDALFAQLSEEEKEFFLYKWKGKPGRNGKSGRLTENDIIRNKKRCF